MTEKIIEFSAKNKFLVILCTVVAVAAAVWSIYRIPLDALPDLSDTQVIVYSRWDRSPDIIEDQVTYPVISSLLGVPHVKSIRGFSDFGYSFVYVIFEDGTDIYWARSRTLEYLSKILPRLPDGVRTELGPDATSIGWVYQYALLDDTGQNSLKDLRSFQDWNLRFQLTSVPGVAEAAAVGGQVKQYQVNLNPSALLALKIPLSRIVEALRKSNSETGGRLIEFSGREYMIRGRGYIKTIEDIENIAVALDEKSGTPVLLRQLGRVELGPEIRRGVADLDGRGDAVSGIAIMRYGENALNVINRIKTKLDEIKPSLPSGMTILPVYDRSELIEKSIATLKSTLVEEVIIVSLVILLFLWHLPSATTAIITIPVSVILAFLPLYFSGMTSNIMSLSGMAISIGVLVDGAIVEVENIYQKIQKWLENGRKEDFAHIRLEALKEVGPSVFFSLLVIAVSFMPVFTLVDQEGRLFKPLAYSKNFAMAIAAILAVTLDPAIRMLYTRYEFFDFKPAWLCFLANHLFVGKYYPEERHPISRILFALYEPACRFVLRHRKATLTAALLAVALTVPAYLKLGSEFMPPLNEGSLLYMPTTLPGISIAEAKRMLIVQDQIIKSFPEVKHVFGKAGRADTSTDPAPFSMVETVIELKSEDQWRKKERWFSFLPEIMQGPFRHIWRDRITQQELIDEMDAKLALPGWSNAWTMPIKNRIDMLSTGIRTPVGVKVFGPDLQKIEEIGGQIEKILRNVAGTRSVFAERTAGGYFLDFTIRREDLARYGLTIDDAQMIVGSAIGGENITYTFEGRERYPVNVRYAREYRATLEDMKRILVPLPGGGQIPIGEIADIHLNSGPAMIRDENGMLAGYVYVTINEKERDLGGYVDEAKSIVGEKIVLPAGYTIQWSGQYENLQRVRERLVFVIPMTLFIIFLLIFFNTGSFVKTGIILLAVPFSLVGAVWLLLILGYHISIAVWVGMIALMGLDAETGAFMLLFLDLSYKKYNEEGKMRTREDLVEAVVHGAVKRVRPKIMTVLAAFLGLLPIMWSVSTGSDLMKRIAAPMVGGLLTSFLLELLIYPVLFFLWKEREHGYFHVEFNSYVPLPVTPERGEKKKRK